MPEPTKFSFTYQEVAELLVRKAGLTEGIWGLQVRFGLNATNVEQPNGEMIPAAILALLEIGLQKFDKSNNLSVDAAQLARAPGKAVERRKK